MHGIAGEGGEGGGGGGCRPEGVERGRETNRPRCGGYCRYRAWRTHCLAASACASSSYYASDVRTKALTGKRKLHAHRRTSNLHFPFGQTAFRRAAGTPQDYESIAVNICLGWHFPRLGSATLPINYPDNSPHRPDISQAFLLTFAQFSRVIFTTSFVRAI